MTMLGKQAKSHCYQSIVDDNIKNNAAAEGGGDIEKVELVSEVGGGGGGRRPSWMVSMIGAAALLMMMAMIGNIASLKFQVKSLEQNLRIYNGNDLLSLPLEGRRHHHHSKDKFNLEEESFDTTIYQVSPEEPAIGDLFIWNNPINSNSSDEDDSDEDSPEEDDSDSEERIQGSCIHTRQNGNGNFEWTCSNSYILKDGTIFLQGALSDDNPVSLWGITGGTGKYSNLAGGQSIVTFTAETENPNSHGLWNHQVTLYYHD